MSERAASSDFGCVIETSRNVCIVVTLNTGRIVQMEIMKSYRMIRFWRFCWINWDVRGRSVCLQSYVSKGQTKILQRSTCYVRGNWFCWINWEGEGSFIIRTFEVKSTLNWTNSHDYTYVESVDAPQDEAHGGIRCWWIWFNLRVHAWAFSFRLFVFCVCLVLIIVVCAQATSWWETTEHALWN